MLEYFPEKLQKKHENVEMEEELNIRSDPVLLINKINELERERDMLRAETKIDGEILIYNF